jgi:hypothetical protein
MLMASRSSPKLDGDWSIKLLWGNADAPMLIEDIFYENSQLLGVFFNGWFVVNVDRGAWKPLVTWFEASGSFTVGYFLKLCLGRGSGSMVSVWYLSMGAAGLELNDGVAIGSTYWSINGG